MSDLQSYSANHFPLSAASSTDDRQLLAGRLRKAREKKGFKSARAFAKFAQEQGVATNETTYYHHENGRRPITAEVAYKYARLLDIPPTEILTGGTRTLARQARVAGTIIDGGKIRDIPANTPERYLALPLDLMDKVDAFQVVGDAMFPAYKNGDAVICEPLKRGDYSEHKIHGQDCIVELESGEKLLRHVAMQSDGRATLHSYREPPMVNMVIVAASPVEMVLKHQAVPLVRRRAPVSA